MNLKELPSLAKDFAVNARYAVRSVFNNINDHGHRICAALGSHSTLSTANKTYHGVKVFALATLFIVGAASLNVEAVAGAGIGLSDEIKSLDEIGTAVLKDALHHKHIT